MSRVSRSTCSGAAPARCPSAPAAFRLLESLLRPADHGAEFGSGRSTIWFAERVAALTSVEHDEQWYEAISAQLKERRLANVDYILARQDKPAELGGQSTYARPTLGFLDAGLDFALLDASARDQNRDCY